MHTRARKPRQKGSVKVRREEESASAVRRGSHRYRAASVTYLTAVGHTHCCAPRILSYAITFLCNNETAVWETAPFAECSGEFFANQSAGLMSLGCDRASGEQVRGEGVAKELLVMSVSHGHAFPHQNVTLAT